MKARTLGIIALFGVVAVAAVAFCVWRLQVARREAADTSARAKRQAVVSLVAPAPLPLGVPLLGPVGVDAEGYPTQWVDRPAVRSLLSHRKLTELSGFIERFQADFEADPRKEYWPADAAAAFDSAEPELRALLDEWVAAAPTSFAPLLARGTYFTAVGFARRGAKWAKDTPNADFDAMADAFAPARADLKRALELRPRAVAAYRGLIQMEAAGGTPAGARHAVDAATATCAACFQVRTVYLLNARPRWGGSYDAMRAYAAAAPVADNRRLALLAGYVDWDLAVIAESEKKYDVALTVIARAIALGDHWAFLLQRASIEARKDDLDAALRDIERAHAQRPGLPEILFERAYVHDHRSAWEPAGRDLLEGMRSEATNSQARRLVPRAVQGLLSEGWKQSQAGNTVVALRMLDLAADLDPANGEVQRWRAAVVLGPTASAPRGDAELDAATARATAAPDDFEVHRSLDYTLARRGQFERVVTMWNEYVSRHPGEGRAYLERGGGQFHLRHLAEAKADATKACDLGVSEACARAKQIR